MFKLFVGFTGVGAGLRVQESCSVLTRACVCAAVLVSVQRCLCLRSGACVCAAVLVSAQRCLCLRSGACICAVCDITPSQNPSAISTISKLKLYKVVQLLHSNKILRFGKKFVSKLQATYLCDCDVLDTILRIYVRIQNRGA